MTKLNKTTLAEELVALPQQLADKKEYAVIIVQDQTEISHGWENDCNFEYCKANNIPYHDYKRGGGTIVLTKGNISLGFIYNNRKYKRFMFEALLTDLKDYFVSKGLNAEINHNDILIDGYKVASSYAHNYGEGYQWTYDSAQISINQDLEVIKNVCLKPMVKVPKGLGEYGVTTEEIIVWVEDWFARNTNDSAL